MRRALGFGIVVAVWWAVAWRVGPLLLPTPAATALALWEERARLLTAAAQTGLGASSGFGLAVAVGAALGTLAFASPRGRFLLSPWLLALQVVPIVAVAPLLVVWLGYGLPVAVATSFIASVFPVYAAARTGLKAPSRDLVDVLALYGATPGQVFVHLRWRAALPALFSGLRVAAGLAVIGAIIGEFVGSNGVPPTLGQIVVYASRSARTDLCFAAIVLAGGLAAALQASLGMAERLCIGRWYGR